MDKLGSLFRAMGLHPLVAFGMTAIDIMLFGAEGISAGLGIPVCIAIALVLIIPCVLIQKYAFNDNWGAALGKGIMVGLLTAIPTPLPSALIVGGGVVGTMGMMLPRPQEAPASSD